MTDVMTPMLKPIPLGAKKNETKPLEARERCEVGGLRRTILPVDPPLMPRPRCKLDEKYAGLKEEAVTYSSGHTVTISASNFSSTGGEIRTF